MKFKWNYIKGGALLIIIVFLYSFANERNEGRIVSKINIAFLDKNDLFITYPAVNKLLIQNDDTVTSITKEKVVLNKLEAALNANQMIQEAHVYYTINGELGATVKQRTPIARVGGETPYYIDIKGGAMPLSPVFSARVPLVTGKYEKDNIDNVYKLAKYIYEDPFLNKNVIGIHRSKDQFELRLRADSFIINFGKAANIDEKFKNFKAFYQKALKDGTLDIYNTVNLQYNNQVVCTKK
ncbi:hypothetical protein [Leptobacterium sp. I13]|uniref:cell division protein FtsQ/DivIB n=1 Tax=Leptobacterium meishanense TaxID=3128904 RepID=UPI0030EF7CF7